LLALGHEVVAVDNLLTGSERNIQHLRSQARFRFVKHDVIEPIAESRADFVFHLASPASPVGYSRHPIETMLVNSVGTHNMLELSRATKAKFLLASTSEVYGDPLVHPQPESYWGNVNPIGPRACYDEGKRFGEALTVNYLWQYDLDARIIRIFNTYGPRNDPEDGRIIPNFISQALRGDPITVYGSGQQTRSFCYVSDLVAGILKAMFSPQSKGEVFNLGTTDERTVREIAEIVKAIANSASDIVHLPAREEEIARRRPDAAKAKAVLGWEPQVPLEQGLTETVAWFRQRLATGD
jgi:nucleoside-diphosphate-sugar epimerase